MPRITFLITGLVYAGAEMQVKQLAIGLRQRGWAVQLITMLQPKAFVEEISEAGIELVSLKMKKGIPDPRAILKLRSLIKAFHPDVVHSHMVHANLLARFTRLLTAMPVLISSAHNSNEGGKIRMLLYRFTDRLCELTTNVSHEAVDAFVRMKASPRHKISMMPNGINLKRFVTSKERIETTRRELGLQNEFVWLAVGRFVDAKDYPTLVKAWKQVDSAYRKGVLLIVGAGPDLARIEKLIIEYGLEVSIRLLGVREDIPALMNASDAYVMSSLWEGLPMVLLEASASELPIVATDIGGSREVVKDGLSGYLAQVSNSKHLAEKMLSMMDLQLEERERMGHYNREHVMQHYELDTILSRWEALYSPYVNSKVLVGSGGRL